jgi:hypothetical protein
MAVKMVDVAVECTKALGSTSLWSKSANKYVHTKDPEYNQARAEQTPDVSAAHPPINQAFKLVFLTAAAGTLLFIAICVGVHIITGGEMPTATQKLVDGLIGMAQIGFGAVVGLLGGQTLRGVNLGAE